MVFTLSRASVTNFINVPMVFSLTAKLALTAFCSTDKFVIGQKMLIATNREVVISDVSQNADLTAENYWPVSVNVSACPPQRQLNQQRKLHVPMESTQSKVSVTNFTNVPTVISLSPKPVQKDSSLTAKFVTGPIMWTVTIRNQDPMVKVVALSNALLLVKTSGNVWESV